MSIAVVCPRCGYEVPEHFLRCPRCGYKIGTIGQLSDTEFPIWEGDFTVVDIQQSERSPRPQYPYPADTRYDERSPRPPATPPHPRDYEVCRCLGTIEEAICGTYYFVSSVIAHEGCARRDCSNSYENNPKICIDWGDKKVIEHKESYLGLRAFLGVLSLISFLFGLAENSLGVLLGIIFLSSAIIPYGSTKREYEKVAFQLVRRSEIPRNARDPWKQKNILETIGMA